VDRAVHGKAEARGTLSSYFPECESVDLVSYFSNKFQDSTSLPRKMDDIRQHGRSYLCYSDFGVTMIMKDGSFARLATIWTLFSS
jgi:hypothetical protein